MYTYFLILGNTKVMKLKAELREFIFYQRKSEHHCQIRSCLHDVAWCLDTCNMFKSVEDLPAVHEARRKLEYQCQSRSTYTLLPRVLVPATYSRVWKIFLPCMNLEGRPVSTMLSAHALMSKGA